MSRVFLITFLCPILIVVLQGGSWQPSTQASATQATLTVPTPASVIGWEPGEDRKMVDTEQLAEYFRVLAAAAPDRVVLTEIGRSYEGRPLQMAIISGEENIRDLARYKEISHKLALAKDLSEEEANALVQEGKAVILIDHGKDGNEPAHGESALLLAHHLVTSDDEDVRLIRQNAIVLIVPCINPDGRERALTWYRQILGTEFEMTAREPWYDHPMIGHEGNRDNVILVSPEMEALAKVNWQEWNPQIVVDQHQGAPYPARIFIPPFQEALNPNISPLTHRGINLVGSAMAMRFEREGKTGVISRASYTTWANGMVDDSSKFHNQIGILVETQQRPARWASPGFTPPESIPKSFNNARMPIGMVPDAPSVFYPNPWKGGAWTFRDQADYMTTAAMGAIEIGAQLKDRWLRTIYQVAKENIEKGKNGKPFAWVLSPDQWDSGEAIELVNALRRGAVEVHQATAPFTAGGKSYPAGTYIIFAAQAFRSVALDLLEPQHHPDLRASPGGNPIPPYDQSGWTLPIGMGVQVDRIDQPFQAQVELETAPAVRTGAVTGQGPVYLLSTRENASFKALNQLWTAGVAVSRAASAFDAGGRSWPVGTFVVRGEEAKLTPIAKSLGVDFVGVGQTSINAARLNRPKVGVYQSWLVVDHNPDEGWARWVLEKYGYEYKSLQDKDIRTGDLSGFTAIILPDQEPMAILSGHRPGTMPPEYVGGLGAEGSANLKRFVERGGTLVAISLASGFAMEQFGLPIGNAVEDVPATELHVPGSYVRTKFDSTHAIAYGMPPEGAVMYFRRQARRQMAFEIVTPAAANDKEAKVDFSIAARFADENLLLSGWEVGADRYLAGTPAVIQVPVGSGNAVLINFRPQYRDQARGTFKIFFNSMLISSTEKGRAVTE